MTGFLGMGQGIGNFNYRGLIKLERTTGIIPGQIHFGIEISAERILTDVFGNIDQNRTWTARRRDMNRFFNDAGNIIGLLDSNSCALPMAW